MDGVQGTSWAGPGLPPPPLLTAMGHSTTQSCPWEDRLRPGSPHDVCVHAPVHARVLSQENLDELWDGGQFCPQLFLVQTKKISLIYICVYIRFFMPL